MKRVLVLNEGNSENLGDQLINFCVLSFFSEYEVQFQSFTCHLNGNEVNSKLNLGIEQKRNKLLKKIIPNWLKIIVSGISWIQKNKSIFKTIKNNRYDLVVIGGGQLLNSFWLFSLALYKWTSLLRKNNILLFSCGVGNIKFFSNISRLLVKKGLRNCKELTIRDLISIQTIKDKFKLDASYLPDPVFSISSIIKGKGKSKNAVILPFSFEDVYAVYNKAGMNKADFLQFWVNKIKIDSEKFETLYVTVTDFIQDKSILDELSQFSFSPNVKFVFYKNWKDLVDLISSSIYIYSGRMHALIIGYSYNCKCESFDVSDKLITFRKEVLESSDNNIEFLKNNINTELLRIKAKYLS